MCVCVCVCVYVCVCVSVRVCLVVCLDVDSKEVLVCERWYREAVILSVEVCLVFFSMNHVAIVPDDEIKSEA